MKIFRLHCLCNVYVLYFIFCFRVVCLGAATVLIFFLNALVLYFYLEHVQRITFCRCFLIFNQAVFCVDDGVVLWLKIKILLHCFMEYNTLTKTVTKTKIGSAKHRSEVYNLQAMAQQ